VQQTGLARIIVIAPHRRVEMTVPEHLPLVGILPTLLRHAGPTLAEDGVGHGGWVLRRIDGDRLDGARSLAMQGVLDGETLVLIPKDSQWPEPAFDDVAEAIADTAGGLGSQWNAQVTARTGRLLAGTALAVGLVALLTASASWQIGALALAGAAALLVTAVCFDRLTGDIAATQLTGGFALLYAGTGAFLLGADGAPARPWPVAAGAAALLFTALVGQVLLPGGVFVAGATLAVGLAAGAALAATTLTTVEGAAAVVAGLTALTLFALPRWAMAIGGVPAPPIPTLTGEVEDPAPPAASLTAAVRRADGLLTGLLFGAFTVIAVGFVPLVLTHTVGGLLLVAAVTTACALRARAFATVRHRIPLIGVAVTGGLGLTWYAWTGSLRVGPAAALVVAGCLVAALVALAVGRRLARRPVAPQLGRLADLGALLCTAAIPVLVALALGLFGFMRGLGG
jgi:type VII secretion integral membrane protein EccD